MKETFYFSHDSNAKDDPKCVLLIEQLGLEGYGIFWVLLETLRDQPDFKYPLILLPALARRFNTSSEKMKAIVYNYGLFKVENDEVFFSESLCQRMKIYLDGKKSKSIAGIKGNEVRWGKQKEIAELSQCDRKTSQSKIKESKVNEIKENIEIRKSNFYESVKKFIDKYPKELLREFYDYWTELNKKGTKMRFEEQKYFELSKRLATWNKNSGNKFNKPKPKYIDLNREEKQNFVLEQCDRYVWLDEKKTKYALVKISQKGLGEYITIGNEQVFLNN